MADRIAQAIRSVRGHKVLLDADLAAVYGVATRVLIPPRAVEMTLYVVRAFVQLREVVLASKALGRKLAELERRLDDHDEAIVELVRAIRQLAAPVPATPTRKIGFF